MTVKEKMLRIMELALEINDPEVRDIGKQKTAVFINWSPHCTSFQVDIHTGSWKPHSRPDIKFVCYPCKDYESLGDSLDDAIKELEEIKEREADV